MNYKNIVNIEFLHRDREKTDPRFYLSHRDEEGKRITVKDPKLFPSYFYVKSNERFLVEDAKEQMKDLKMTITSGYKSMFGDDLIKISFGKMSRAQFKQVREHFRKTFEDDVLYNYRYIIDNEVTYSSKQRILYFDIETLLSLDIEDTPQPIISICAYDNFTKKYFYFFYHPKATEKKEKRTHIDGDGKEHELFIYYRKSEVEMLEDFMKFVRVINPDVITAWNSDWFDIPYLLNRIRKIGLYPGNMSTLNKAYTIIGKEKDQTRSKIYGMSIVDLKKVYEKLTYDNKPDSYSLSTVAQHTLNDDKTEIAGVKVLWENPENWEKLMEYNVKDVELCVRIDNKNNLMNYFLTVQQIIPIPAEDIMMNSRVVDMFLLQRYNKKFVFPSKRYNSSEGFMAAFAGRLDKVYEKDNQQLFNSILTRKEEPFILDKDENERYVWVGREPKAKVFKNVVVLDFASLYPSIFRTFNVSPDTVDENGEIDAIDVKFTNKRIGLIPAVIGELIEERKKLEAKRDEIKDSSSTEYFSLQNLQGAVKAIINSFSGVLGFPNFRLYDLRVAAAITYFGRLFLTIITKELQKKGFEVCLNDTDSAGVVLDESLDPLNNEEDAKTLIELSKKLQEELNVIIEEEALRLGAKKNYLLVDAEKIFSGLLFRGVKKQYFGRLFYKKGHMTNEIFSRGMDIVRRDTPRAIKPIMSNMIERILNKEDMKEAKQYVDDKLKELKGLGAWQIGSTKRLSKNIRPLDMNDSKITIDTYKNNNIQNVKACLFSNYFLGTNWQKADYPKLIAVKMTPSEKIKEQVDEFVKKWGLSEIDYVAIDEDTKLPDWIEIDYDKMFEKFVYMRLKLFENVEGVEVRRLYSKNTFLGDFFDLETGETEEGDDNE